MDEFDELATKIRTLARGEAQEASRPIERGKVVKRNPLVVELMNRSLRLEEGDPDVEIDRSLLGLLKDSMGHSSERPQVGQTVAVQRDSDGDYLITAVMR